MKKKKTHKGSLKSSILLLLVMAIILVTASYAWFTSNEAVKVSSLDVNVQAKNGLQLSVDAENWKTIISKTDITTNAYTGNVNQLPAVLEPVSTAGNVTSGRLDLFYASANPDSVTGEYMLTTTDAKLADAAGTSGHYIAFDLFFKVDRPTNISLGTGSNVSIKEGTTDKGLKNAARIAFLVEGNGPVDTDVDVLTAYTGATAATRFIWEPNYDVHKSPAITHALQTYGITTEATGADIIEYDGIASVIADADDVKVSEANATDHSTLFGRTPIAYAIPETPLAATDIFSLSAGVTKVRVYMWVEGQDVDCENNASGSDIVFDLQIETSAVQP